MSFRIHTSSPELKRDLEKKLAELEGQLDGDCDYEISAEVLPAEQGLERARSLAVETGVDSVFVAAGTFAKKDVELPAPTHVEPTVADPEVHPVAPVQSGDQQPSRLSFDSEKVRQTLTEQSARARELSGKLAARTGSFVKSAGASSANGIKQTSKWLGERGAQARLAGGELRKRFAEKAERSRQQAAEWNARRLDCQAAEAKARAERERAAHREAELAAAAAHIMHREQKKEAEQTAMRQKARVIPPAPPITERVHERDTWPIWRNAFAAAACLALVGIFMLAAGGKQSKASPATSTENVRPALPTGLPLPSIVKVAPQAKPVAQKPVAALPVAKVANPSPSKRVARMQDDTFEEVTVRHYPNASPIAPPKRDAKGVVQISDME
jgi:hypothetical protein